METGEISSAFQLACRDRSPSIACSDSGKTDRYCRMRPSLRLKPGRPFRTSGTRISCRGARAEALHYVRPSLRDFGYGARGTGADGGRRTEDEGRRTGADGGRRTEDGRPEVGRGALLIHPSSFISYPLSVLSAITLSDSSSMQERRPPRPHPVSTLMTPGSIVSSVGSVCADDRGGAPGSPPSPAPVSCFAMIRVGPYGSGPACSRPVWSAVTVNASRYRRVCHAREPGARRERRGFGHIGATGPPVTGTSRIACRRRQPVH